MLNTRLEVNHPIKINFKSLDRSEVAVNLYEIIETDDSLIVQLNQSDQRYHLSMGQIYKPNKSLIIRGGSSNEVSIQDSQITFHNIDITSNKLLLEKSTTITTNNITTHTEAIITFANITALTMENLFSEQGTGFKNGGKLTLHKNYLQIFGSMINEGEIFAPSVQISSGGLIANKAGARWTSQSQDIASVSYVNDGHVTATISEINSNNIIVNGLYAGDTWRLAADNALIFGCNSHGEVEELYCHSLHDSSIAGNFSNIDQSHFTGLNIFVEDKAIFKGPRLVKFNATQLLTLKKGVVLEDIQELFGSANELIIQCHLQSRDLIYLKGANSLTVESGNLVNSGLTILISNHVLLEKYSRIGLAQQGELKVFGSLIESFGDLQTQTAELRADMSIKTDRTTNSHVKVLTMIAPFVTLDGVYEGDTLNCFAAQHLFLMLSVLLNVKYVEGEAPVTTLAGSIHSGLLLTANIINNHATIASTGDTNLLASILLANSPESKVDSNNVRFKSKTILNEGRVTGLQSVDEHGSNVYQGKKSETEAPSTSIRSDILRVAGQYRGLDVKLIASQDLTVDDINHTEADKLQVVAGKSVNGGLNFDCKSAEVVGFQSVTALTGKMQAKEKLVLQTNDLHLNNKLTADRILQTKIKDENQSDGDSSRVMIGKDYVANGELVEEDFRHAQVAGDVNAAVVYMDNDEMTLEKSAAVKFRKNVFLSADQGRVASSFLQMSENSPEIVEVDDTGKVVDKISEVPVDNQPPKIPSGVFIKGKSFVFDKQTKFTTASMLNVGVDKVSFAGDYDVPFFNVKSDHQVFTKDANVPETVIDLNLSSQTANGSLIIEKGARMNSKAASFHNFQQAIIDSNVTSTQIIAKLKSLLITVNGSVGSENSKVSIEVEKMEHHGWLLFLEATIKCYESYYQSGAHVKGTRLNITAPLYQSYGSIIEAQQFIKTTPISIEFDVKIVNWLTEISALSISAFPRCLHPQYLLTALKDIKGDKINLADIFTLQNTIQATLSLLRPFAPRLVMAMNVAMSTYFIGKTTVALYYYGKKINFKNLRFTDTLPLLAGAKNIGISGAYAISSSIGLVEELKQPVEDAFNHVIKSIEHLPTDFTKLETMTFYDIAADIAAEATNFVEFTVPAELKSLFQLPSVDQVVAVGTGLATAAMPMQTNDSLVRLSCLEPAITGTAYNRSLFSVAALSPIVAANDVGIGVVANVDFSPHLAVNYMQSGYYVLKGGAPDVAYNLSISADNFKQVLGSKEIGNSVVFDVAHMHAVNAEVRKHTVVKYTTVEGSENDLLTANDDYANLNPTADDASASVSYVKNEGEITPPSQQVKHTLTFTGPTVNIKAGTEIDTDGSLAFKSTEGAITNAGTENAKETISQDSVTDVVQLGAQTHSKTNIIHASGDFISKPRDIGSKVVGTFEGRLLVERTQVNSNNNSEYGSVSATNVSLDAASITYSHTGSVTAEDKVSLKTDYYPITYNYNENSVYLEYTAPAAIIGGDGQGSANNVGLVVSAYDIENVASNIAGQATVVVLAQHNYEAKAIVQTMREVYSGSSFGGFNSKEVSTTPILRPTVASQEGDVIVVAKDNKVISESGKYSAPHGSVVIDSQKAPQYTSSHVTTVIDESSGFGSLTLGDKETTIKKYDGQEIDAKKLVDLRNWEGDNYMPDSKISVPEGALITEAKNGSTIFEGHPMEVEVCEKDLTLGINLGILQVSLSTGSKEKTNISLNEPNSNALEALDNSKLTSDKLSNMANLGNIVAGDVIAAKDHNPLRFVGNSVGLSLNGSHTHTTAKLPSDAGVTAGAWIVKDGHGGNVIGETVNAGLLELDTPSFDVIGKKGGVSSNSESLGASVNVSPNGVTETVTGSKSSENDQLEFPAIVNTKVIDVKQKGVVVNLNSGQLSTDELRGEKIEKLNITSKLSEINKDSYSASFSHPAAASYSEDHVTASKVVWPSFFFANKVTGNAGVNKAVLIGGELRGAGLAAHPPKKVEETKISSVEKEQGFSISKDEASYTNTTTQSITGGNETVYGFKSDLLLRTDMFDLAKSLLHRSQNQNNDKVAQEIGVDDKSNTGSTSHIKSASNSNASHQQNDIGLTDVNQPIGINVRFMQTYCFSSIGVSSNENAHDVDETNESSNHQNYISGKYDRAIGNFNKLYKDGAEIIRAYQNNPELGIETAISVRYGWIFSKGASRAVTELFGAEGIGVVAAIGAGYVYYQDTRYVMNVALDFINNPDAYTSQLNLQAVSDLTQYALSNASNNLRTVSDELFNPLINSVSNSNTDNNYDWVGVNNTPITIDALFMDQYGYSPIDTPVQPSWSDFCLQNMMATGVSGVDIGAAVYQIYNPNLKNFGIHYYPPLFNNIGPEHSDHYTSGGAKFFTVDELKANWGTFNGIYVVDSNGKLYLSERGFGYEATFHSDVHPGPVPAAGEFSIFNGYKVTLNNKTGHFRVYGDAVEQIALYAFKKAGFDDVTYEKFFPVTHDFMRKIAYEFVLEWRFLNPGKQIEDLTAAFEKKFTPALTYKNPDKLELSNFFSDAVKLLDVNLGTNLHPKKSLVIEPLSSVNFMSPAATISSKALGGALVAVGMYLDAHSLYQQVQISRQTGNYNNSYREGTRILSAWTGSFVGGALGAEIGAFICAPVAPPVGPAVCAAIGSIAGSTVGYSGASQASLYLSNNMAQKPYSNSHRSTLFYQPASVFPRLPYSEKTPAAKNIFFL